MLQQDLCSYWMGDQHASGGLLYFGVEEQKEPPKPATLSETNRLFAVKHAIDRGLVPPLKTVVVVVDMQNDYSTSSKNDATRCARYSVPPLHHASASVAHILLWTVLVGRSQWAADLDETADRIARFLYVLP
jgi:hypothetical protein